MVIEPHPDDMILMCGGVVARAVIEGKNVYVLTLTGGGGSALREEEARRETRIRRIESRRADLILGISLGNKTICRKMLNCTTKQILNNPAEIYYLILKEIRAYKPDLVITMHRDNRHPLHVYIAENAEEILFQAGENIRTGEFGEPVRAELWLGESPRSQLDKYDLVYVDICRTLELKLQALRTQKSQIYVLGSDIIEKVETLAKYRGMQAGIAYAEAFNKINVYRKSV